MQKQLSIVIPAYNEQDSIGSVLADLKALLSQHGIEHEVLVIDDGSTDATAQRAAAAGARVLRHHSNRGYGAALKTGVTAAAYPVVAITDADGTYPNEYLPQMLEQIEQADMVVGARTGAKVNIPLVRRPAKWALNRLANFVSGFHIPDINSGLRVFRRDVALQYFPILPDQFSWTTTITMAMLCDKYAVRFIPIDYRKRVGKSKITPWDAGTFTILILRMAVLFRPLRVFLPLVAAALGYGVVKSAVDLLVIGDRNISASAILAFTSGLNILLVGMVADAISRMGRLSPKPVAGVRAAEATEMSQGGGKS